MSNSDHRQHCQAFSQELDRFLRERNISRNAFAHQIGYDPSYINRLCNGQRSITNKDIIDVILNALDVHGYERTRILWENGLVDNSTFPKTISEEVFTMLAALASK